jgi:hypothetical protein
MQFDAKQIDSNFRLFEKFPEVHLFGGIEHTLSLPGK